MFFDIVYAFGNMGDTPFHSSSLKLIYIVSTWNTKWGMREAWVYFNLKLTFILYGYLRNPFGGVGLGVIMVYIYLYI